MRNYKSRFELPQKPGTFAYIQTDVARKLGLVLMETVRRKWNPPGWFYHFARGGHVSALNVHAKNRIFARLDIDRFYPSITRNKVGKALQRIGFPFLDAREEAHRSCVLTEHGSTLPFGFVQSPLLASLVLERSSLGTALKSVRKAGVSVSVYMDDIVMSHAGDANLIEESCGILTEAGEACGLLFSKKKRQGPSDQIDAFNISLSYSSLAINKERFEGFRARVQDGLRNQSTAGVVGYVRTVNGTQADELADYLK